MTRGGQDRPEPTLAQRRRDRERAAARESILSAALDVARRDGWDAVTMRRLADEIEYSANFAYRYFSGRDDILLALVRSGFARLYDAMAAAAAATARRPVRPTSPPRARPARPRRRCGGPGTPTSTSLWPSPTCIS